MIKLAVNCPNPKDNTSFFRGIGPINALVKQCRRLMYYRVNEWDWTTLSACDVMFLQRPYTPAHFQLMQMAQDHRIPTWIDYDDLLIAMPTDNPAYFHYNEHRATIAKCIEQADVITCSTQYLARAIKVIAKGKVLVIPNALHDQFDKPNHGPRNKNVMWRGSRTHERDVFTYADQIIRTARNEEFKEFKWHWVGDNMWFCSDSIPSDRCVIYPPVDHMAYHRLITEKIAPTLVIVPLHLSPFNLAKSNNAWLEATYCGAMTLAPDWDEWKRPGVINYRNQDDFMSKLESVLRGTKKVECHVPQSWAYIQSNLRLKHVNHQRIQVICDILNVQPHDLGVSNATAVEMASANAREDFTAEHATPIHSDPDATLR